jgi:hypothetical protein
MSEEEFGCNSFTLYVYGIVCGFYCCCAPWAHVIMCCFPPGAILIQKNLSPEKWKIFQFVGEQSRADPAENGHVHIFGEESWQKVMIITIVLTLCGFIPGIIFVFFIVYRHLIAFMMSVPMFPDCFNSCCSKVCCVEVNKDF